MEPTLTTATAPAAPTTRAVDITPTPAACRQIARLFRAQQADAEALAARAAQALDATDDAALAPWDRALLAAAFEALHDAELARAHTMAEGLDALGPYAADGDGSDAADGHDDDGEGHDDAA